MDRTQVLTGVAEVAIALAGFSGVVVVFRRNEDPWLPEDRFRLSALILSSFMAAAFAFLPLVLWEVAGTEGRVWRVSSALWSIFGLGTVSRRRASGRGPSDPRASFSRSALRRHVWRQPLSHCALACERCILGRLYSLSRGTRMGSHCFRDPVRSHSTVRPALSWLPLKVLRLTGSRVGVWGPVIVCDASERPPDAGQVAAGS